MASIATRDSYHRKVRMYHRCARGGKTVDCKKCIGCKPKMENQNGQ